MHVVQDRVRQRQRRRVNLPSERMVINGAGLGELDGMFNFGKMFTRMFTFTPSSFKFKNIAGTIGAAATTLGTFGMANVASEILGSSGLKVVKGGFTSTHSKPMQYVGYGTMAAAAATGLYYGGTTLLSKAGVGSGAGTTAGAIPVGTGTVLAPVVSPVGTGTVLATGTGITGGGILSTIGTTLTDVGSGLMTVMKALPVVGGLFGGKGGAPQDQQQAGGGMTQAEFDAQQKAAYDAGVRQQQQEALYRQQVAEQQAQMMPIAYSGGGSQPTMQTSYGDLRTPYTAITEDGQQVQVDPRTGEVVQPGMSTEVMVGIGALVAMAGLYYAYSDSK